MSAKCCAMRTGVLLFGFSLGTAEVTLWVVFYTFRASLRESAGYSARNEEDLIAVSVVVFVDLVVNVLLICGANKDYSGRRRDLRRWAFMVPWALVYAVNLVVILIASLYMFWSLPGGYKSLGCVPLVVGAAMAIGYILVLFFIVEQRQDLSIFLTQQAALEAQERAERDKMQAAGGGKRGAVS